MSWCLFNGDNGEERNNLEILCTEMIKNEKLNEIQRRKEDKFHVFFKVFLIILERERERERERETTHSTIHNRFRDRS